jgi:hypothetical protein
VWLWWSGASVAKLTVMSLKFCPLGPMRRPVIPEWMSRPPSGVGMATNSEGSFCRRCLGLVLGPVPWAAACPWVPVEKPSSRAPTPVKAVF